MNNGKYDITRFLVGSLQIRIKTVESRTTSADSNNRPNLQNTNNTFRIRGIQLHRADLGFANLMEALLVTFSRRSTSYTIQELEKPRSSCPEHSSFDLGFTLSQLGLARRGPWFEVGV